MTPEELAQAEAALATAQTEIEALAQQRRDCIAKAREFNDATKACTNKITAIENQVAPLKAAVQAHQVEQKRLRAEAIVAERKRKDAEAKAKEATELEKAKARIAELEAAQKAE